jgi:HEAT repeat protein
VLAALEDENELVQKEALNGLTEMGPRIAPELVRVLPQKSGRTRDGLLSALTAMGSAVVPHVQPLLKSQNASERALGVQILGQISPAPAEAKTVLLPLLKDPDTSVRMKTAVALSNIDPTLAETVPAHIEIVKRKVWDSDTEAAVKTLRVLGPKAKTAVPALTALIKVSDDNVKDKNAPRPLICEALNRIDPRRNGAVGLLWDLKQNDPVLRYRAAYNLSEATPPNVGALPDLLRAMDDKDMYVRARATVAAARIGFDKSQRLKPALTKKAVESLAVVKDERVKGFSETIQEALAIRPPKADEESATLNETPTATAP